MTDLEHISLSFKIPFSKERVIETDKDLSYEHIVSSGISLPNQTDLSTTIKSLLIGDDILNLSIKLGDSDTIDSSSHKDISEFISEINSQLKFHLDEDPIIFSLKIYKQTDQFVSIYDLEAFTRFLSSQSLTGLMYIFSEAFSDKGAIIFRLAQIEIKLVTPTICFIGRNDDVPKSISSLNRFDTLSKIELLCHFAQFHKYKLSPMDFDIQIQNNLPSTLLIILSKIKFSLLITSVFDMTEIGENTIQFKLNGYKSIAGSLNFSEFCLTSIKSYTQIFKWIYSGSNTTDKIGLARNIISLHLDHSNLYISNGAFDSIKSAYKIYEKENIKQYIEIRSKISDQIIDFENRASKIVDSFAVGFQRSILAVITFFSSVVVLRIIGKNTSEKLISFDVFILTLFFILASIIYLFLLRLEVTAQKNRIINSYDNLIDRYKDLLVFSDINKILNNNKDFNSDLKFIDKKKKWYTNLWVGILALLLIATLFLHFR